MFEQAVLLLSTFSPGGARGLNEKGGLSLREKIASRSMTDPGL